MKKFIYLLFVLLFIVSCDTSIRQNYSTMIIPFSDDGERWGLVSIQGEKIVENEWEYPSSISTDGIVRIRNKDGMYEFYTSTSNPQKIGAKYRNATLFSEGLSAVVVEQGFIHYIDKNGNIKFELPDDGKGSPVQKAGVFSEGLARFQNAENLWGYIDQMGNVVIKPTYDYAFNFKEGFALVEKYNATTNETSRGFINKQGSVVIPLEDRYSAFGFFSEGLAACTDREAKNQWGFINHQGDRVIEITNKRVKVGHFRDGVAPFFDGDYYGLIDKSGSIIINPKYDSLMMYFWNDRGPYTNSSNLIGFINANRDEVINPKFQEILPFFYNTTVVKDNYYYFIDRSGEDVAKSVYIRHVPISIITNQFLNFQNQLVQSLNLNLKIIVDEFINSFTEQSVNGLTYTSSVCDVINIFKLTRRNLPQNTYTRRMTFTSSVAGNLMSNVTVEFVDPIQTDDFGAGNIKPNCDSKLRSIVLELDVSQLEQLDLDKLKSLVEDKIKNAGFIYDENLSNQSWHDNDKIYSGSNARVEFLGDSDSFYLFMDFSAMYNL